MKELEEKLIPLRARYKIANDSERRAILSHVRWLKRKYTPEKVHNVHNVHSQSGGSVHSADEFDRTAEKIFTL